ncbi:MAG: ZIP family metal transporter [Alicyclobacillus sp.]|nr:ZIP family metal transporter [Alicyclobacillus sp.]
MSHLALLVSIVVSLCAAGAIIAGASLTLGAATGALSAASTSPSPRLVNVFSFATGAFVAAVVLDFLPDAWSARGAGTGLWMFVGAVVMMLATHAADGLFVHVQGPFRDGEGWQHLTPASGLVLVSALSFHTFLEGSAVAVAGMEWSWQSVGFDLAVILHKVPEGVLWGLALCSVFPADRPQLRRLLFIPAVSTLVGMGVGAAVAAHVNQTAMHGVTGVVAGAMLVIAFSELVPALRELPSTWRSRAWLLAGLLLMGVVTYGGSLLGS